MKMKLLFQTVFSYDKFLILGKNYKKLVDKNIFDSKIKTSMEIIPKESSISSVKIGSQDDGKNVYSVNRMIKCDFYKKYVVKDFQTKGKVIIITKMTIA